MVKFDRLKLVTSFENVKSFDRYSDAVRYKPTINKQNEIEAVSHEMNGYPEFGIRKTYIKETNNEIILDFSAKILLDDYNKLVSIDNIQQCIERYNEVSPMQLDVSKVIEDSRVLNCDTTQMIYPKYGINLCADSLMMLSTKDRCKVTRYKKKQNSGLQFDASILKEKRRLILYDKFSAITKGLKTTNIFLSKCNNPTKVINQCKDSLRVEQNHCTLKSIRNRFKVIDNNLLSVLQSAESVNYNFFKSVKQQEKQKKELGYQFDLFEFAEKKRNISHLVKEVGYRGIIVMCNFDIDKIRGVLSLYADKEERTRQQFNKCKEYMNIMLREQFEENNKGQKSEEINNYIFQLIKTA